MLLFRAYYDAYIRERLIYETELESRAKEVLRQAARGTCGQRIDAATSILNRTWTNPVAQDYKKRCWECADYLFEAIGSQTSVKKHQAQSGRGDFMDYIDTPLSDVIWLLSQFDRIKQAQGENAKLSLIEELLNRENPGPGGFYDNLGQSLETPRLVDYPVWEEDPGSLRSPRVGFETGLRGKEWIYTVQATGFDGIAIPLAWMNQITTLYEMPLSVVYEDLDPHTNFVLRVAYTGRFRAKIRLTADDKFQIHEIMETGTIPISEFAIPSEATRDGRLKLTWTCAEGERGTQVAELWLIASN